MRALGGSIWQFATSAGARRVPTYAGGTLTVATIFVAVVSGRAAVMPLAWGAALCFLVALVWAYHDLRLDRDRLAAELEQVVEVAGDRLLDDLIREGQAVRTQIVHDEHAGAAVVRWVKRATPALAEHFPAYVDAFRLAKASHEHFSGQARVIKTINAKLAILTQARREWRPPSSQTR